MSPYKWYVFLIVLTIGCSPNAEHNSNTNTFRIDSISFREFAEAKSNNHSGYNALSFKKNNGVLKLPISDGISMNYVIFKDTLVDTDNEQKRIYQFIGQLKKSQFYVVEANFYEHYEVYIINKRTGIKSILWDKPKISPSGKYIADIKPYILEGEPNGLQIWKVNLNTTTNENPLTKVFELNQLNWVPLDFVWQKENVLLLKVLPYNIYDSQNDISAIKGSDYHYLEIHLLD